MRLLTLIGLCLYLLGFQLIEIDRDQEQVRKILVVPFDRFELHSEVKMEDINRVNETSGDEYYNLIYAALTEAFETSSTENVVYKIIDPDTLKEFKSSLTYDLYAKEGHYRCSLDKLDLKKYKKILEKADCDYMLTINWYRIMLIKRGVKVDKVKKIGYYSYHFFDYDVFTTEKTRILSDSKLKMEVPISKENYTKMGLRILDMKPLYKTSVENMTNKISNMGEK